MKSFLLYGQREKTTPWLNRYQSNPDGSLDIEITGVHIYEIADSEKDILWFNLFNSEKSYLLSQQELDELSFNPDPDPYASFDRYIERLWDNLLSYCNSKSNAEKNFLDMYLQLCLHDSSGGAPADKPALLPQVFVNWAFNKRVRQKNTEPYIVDFVFKHKAFGTSNLTIVEIDGRSHFADYRQGNYFISEKKYAEHLKKDRWLRRNGFNLVRIANNEIEDIMKLEERERLKAFYKFFQEVFGHIIRIDKFEFPQ